MKATTAPLPPDDGWAFEVKWDGVRILSKVGGGRIQLRSSNGIDASSRYPELHALADGLGDVEAILDGEVVAFDEHGRPSFGLLQSRMHLAKAAEARQRSEITPITYVLFDVIEVDGRDV